MAITPCDCLLAISGVPEQWSVVMSGVTNTMSCNTCTNANATYVLAHPALVPAPCTWTTAFGVCGFSPTVALTVSQNADGTTNLTVQFGGGGGFATYALSNLVGALTGTYTLTKTGGTANCNTPSTITATAVPPAFATLKQNSQTDLDCYAGLSRGIAPGSPLRGVAAPFFGGPLSAPGVGTAPVLPDLGYCDAAGAAATTCGGEPGTCPAGATAGKPYPGGAAGGAGSWLGKPYSRGGSGRPATGPGTGLKTGNGTLDGVAGWLLGGPDTGLKVPAGAGAGVVNVANGNLVPLPEIASVFWR